MVDALEELARSYLSNAEQQDAVCDKHGIPLIKIMRTGAVVCRMCESERIHEENQAKVDELANAEQERERKFYLEKFSLYDDVLKNATLDNFDPQSFTPNTKTIQNPS